MDRQAWSSWHDLKEAWYGGVRFEGKLRRKRRVWGCWIVGGHTWSMGFAFKIVTFIDDLTTKAEHVWKTEDVGWGRRQLGEHSRPWLLPLGVRVRVRNWLPPSASGFVSQQFSHIPSVRQRLLRCGNPILQPWPHNRVLVARRAAHQCGAPSFPSKFLTSYVG